MREDGTAPPRLPLEGRHLLLRTRDAIAKVLRELRAAQGIRKKCPPLVPPAVNKVLTDMNIIGEANPAELPQRARYDAKLLATAWVR
jgi:hypothetical protein